MPCVYLSQLLAPPPAVRYKSMGLRPGLGPASHQHSSVGPPSHQPSVGPTRQQEQVFHPCVWPLAAAIPSVLSASSPQGHFPFSSSPNLPSGANLSRSARRDQGRGKDLSRLQSEHLELGSHGLTAPTRLVHPVKKYDVFPLVRNRRNPLAEISPEERVHLSLESL